MPLPYFNHQQLKRYMLAFASFFTGFQVRRVLDSGDEAQRLEVPIEYGPKERWMARLVQDPDFTKSVSMTVPRMAFTLESISGDFGRHFNTLDKLVFPSEDQRKLARLYVGVPYKLNFNLDILVKYESDGLQLLEQILPMFTPDLTFRLKPVPELGFLDQIPLTLLSVTNSDNYDGDFEHRRAIIWTLTFGMPVNFYGPVKQASRIQEVIIDLYNAPLNDMLDPPVIIETEDGTGDFDFAMESIPATVDSRLNALVDDELNTSIDDLILSGHIMDESTSNTFLTTGRVARIDAQANASGGIITTITETDGDVKRNVDGNDEEL